jgi:transcriptional regulator with XRE-family HTH domain
MGPLSRDSERRRVIARLVPFPSGGHALCRRSGQRTAGFGSPESTGRTASPPNGHRATRKRWDKVQRGTHVTNPQASTELARLVRSCRERLNPDEIPGLNAGRAGVRRRRRRTVSQELVANLVGYSVGWYSSLERGEPQNYSTDFLDRVAYTLRLTRTEKTLLFLYATGHDPAVQRPSSKADLAKQLKPVLEAQPWPAYISDEAWDLVDSNTHMRDWFPWVTYERNVMRWVFTYPESRKQLYRWETVFRTGFDGDIEAWEKI